MFGLIGAKQCGLCYECAKSVLKFSQVENLAIFLEQRVIPLHSKVGHPVIKPIMYDDDVVVGNKACSCIWAICGSSNAIGSSYGPIDIVQLLSFPGGGQEGSQNTGGAEVIWLI